MDMRSAGRGYNTVRNPIFRQMLKMRDVPVMNSRGCKRNGYCTEHHHLLQHRKRSIVTCGENETRALIRIFPRNTEDVACWFLWVWEKGGLYRQDQNFFTGQRCYRLASFEKMYPGKAGATGNRRVPERAKKEHRQAGTVLRRNDPSAGFPDQLPVNSGNKEEEEREIRDLLLLPLEYIYSLVRLKKIWRCADAGSVSLKIG